MHKNSRRHKNSREPKLLLGKTTLPRKKIGVEKPNRETGIYHKRRNDTLPPDVAHLPMLDLNLESMA
jgi:hypothetical protein